MKPTLLLLLASMVSADPRSQFEDFKARAGRTYASLQEEEARFAVFQDNLKMFAKHNAEGHTWTMGVTKFADLTQ
jgi:cathepsin L